jgi:hypothetical protein
MARLGAMLNPDVGVFALARRLLTFLLEHGLYLLSIVRFYSLLE